jgi:hypothetical protein
MRKHKNHGFSFEIQIYEFCTSRVDIFTKHELNSFLLDLLVVVLLGSNKTRFVFYSAVDISKRR